uniref:ORF35Rb n=1 Tax=Cydia pomonella granulosis virus TaxID=28289 RepID=O39627_GVCP|nr:unknown [Cydia pomonella granulovirus]
MCTNLFINKHVHVVICKINYPILLPRHQLLHQLFLVHPYFNHLYLMFSRAPIIPNTVYIVDATHQLTRVLSTQTLHLLNVTAHYRIVRRLHFCRRVYSVLDGWWYLRGYSRNGWCGSGSLKYNEIK